MIAEAMEVEETPSWLQLAIDSREIVVRPKKLSVRGPTGWTVRLPCSKVRFRSFEPIRLPAGAAPITTEASRRIRMALRDQREEISGAGTARSEARGPPHHHAARSGSAADDRGERSLITSAALAAFAARLLYARRAWWFRTLA